MRRSLMWLLLVVVGVACSKEGGGAAGALDGAVEKLAKAGVKVEGWTAVTIEKLPGATCKQGRAGESGVEVTVCELGDASRAKKYEPVGYEVIGEATGSSLAEGTLLLVVADRKGGDKEGKVIDAVTKGFRGK